MNWKKWIGFSVIALVVSLLSVPDARRIFSSKRKTKLFFGVLLSTSRAAGLASLLGVLLKKCSNFVQKTPPKLKIGIRSYKQDRCQYEHCGGSARAFKRPKGVRSRCSPLLSSQPCFVCPSDSTDHWCRGARQRISTWQLSSPVNGDGVFLPRPRPCCMQLAALEQVRIRPGT